MALEIAIALLAAIIADEIMGWSEFAARALVRRAARRLPAELAARYEEEWLAELAALSSRRVAGLAWAFSQPWLGARRLQRELKGEATGSPLGGVGANSLLQSCVIQVSPLVGSTLRRNVQPFVALLAEVSQEGAPVALGRDNTLILTRVSLAEVEVLMSEYLRVVVDLESRDNVVWSVKGARAVPGVEVPAPLSRQLASR